MSHYILARKEELRRLTQDVLSYAPFLAGCASFFVSSKNSQWSLVCIFVQYFRYTNVSGLRAREGVLTVGSTEA